MTNFCTLFDSNYLSRGLALYESLIAVCPSFHLYVVAFNDECYEYLQRANLSGITPISLSEFEDEALLQVKPTRSAGEYCWTCTPSVILYCIEHFNLKSCTYIDADMVFYHNPDLLIEEMSDCSVLLTEHHYTCEYDQSKSNGKYCVQFMCFKNDKDGMAALRWWRERCLEWCYAYLEDNKFGDQKYLDDWSTRFEGVHVLQNLGGGVAPWNVQQFNIREENGSLVLLEKKTGREYPLVFFHFHGLKFYKNEIVSCSGSLYELDTEVKEFLYFPYIRTLLKTRKKLEQQGVTFNIDGARTVAPGKLKQISLFIKERLALLKAGRISPLQLNLFKFNLHNHLYSLGLFKGK